MKKQDMVGLGRVVMHRRERLLMLQARGSGITATALRYKPEVRKEDAYFDEIPTVKVPADMLQLAEHILEQKKGHFDPDKFEDRYEDAVKALLKRKGAGEPAKKEEPAPSNVVNIMDALRKSVAAEKGGGHTRARSSARRAPTKRSGARPPARSRARAKRTG